MTAGPAMASRLNPRRRRFDSTANRVHSRLREMQPVSENGVPVPSPVLIVEDEPEVALGLSELFEHEGVLVEVATNGAGGIQAVERFRPDVVILDVSLPDISGFEVFVSLANQFPDARVIFSTGHGTEKQLDGLPRTRFVSLLRKPYEFQRLLDEIDAALRA